MFSVLLSKQQAKYAVLYISRFFNSQFHSAESWMKKLSAGEQHGLFNALSLLFLEGAILMGLRRGQQCFSVCCAFQRVELQYLYHNFLAFFPSALNCELTTLIFEYIGSALVSAAAQECSVSLIHPGQSRNRGPCHRQLIFVKQPQAPQCWKRLLRNTKLHHYSRHTWILCPFAAS